MDNDFALARALQAQFDEEDAHEEVSSFIPEEFRHGSPARKIRAIDGPPETSIIAPEWEDLDPTPGKISLRSPRVQIKGEGDHLKKIH